MAGSTNLAREVRESIPEELLALVEEAGEVAGGYGEGLYLVGGVVRDILLGRPNLDLDLVLEGDAIELAGLLAEKYGGDSVVHRRFGTAKFRKGGFSIDLARARSETYERPGALPKVRPGSLMEDLARRDFTINAMAVHLDRDRFGELLDPYGGKEDLDNGLVRVLHPGSFIDDATRILRALRYEQRLGFHLEGETERLLRRGVNMMETVSGDRLRHEIELILKEECPERMLLRGEELGVLSGLHPSLRGDGWIAERFEMARKATTPDVGLYLSLLLYRLNEEDVEGILSRLRIVGRVARAITDTIRLKSGLPSLEDRELLPSAIYRILEGYSPQAIWAAALASPSQVVSSNLIRYVNNLRYTRPLLDGKALKGLGVAEGPRIGEMMRALLEARLDGKVETREDEEALVRQLLLSDSQG